MEIQAQRAPQGHSAVDRQKQINALERENREMKELLALINGVTSRGGTLVITPSIAMPGAETVVCVVKGLGESPFGLQLDMLTYLRWRAENVGVPHADSIRPVISDV